MGILTAKHLTMQFGGLTAVSDFNLDLAEGEIVGLIGPNGAGKTTAFNMITGVYKPTKGELYYQEQNITGYRPDQITKLGIARTFQNIRLFTRLSVLDNVMVAQHLRLDSGPVSSAFWLSNYRREEKRMREKALRLLEAVQLQDLYNESAGSLPYGKQRRLEIARALATDPKVLLLDEPAAGMNPQESLELMEFIAKIREEFGLTVFMIEHHMQVVMGICERIFVLDHGITIAHGTPSEIQHNPKVIEAYLGVEANA